MENFIQRLKLSHYLRLQLSKNLVSLVRPYFFMKRILLLIGMLALAGFPAHAGANVFVSFGGGGAHFHGGSFAASGIRCGYSAGCYPFRSRGFVGYPGYGYGGYGYYGGYDSSYYPESYSDMSYAPVQPAPPEIAPSPAPPATATTPAPAAPPVQMLFGILDVNGFVHSPYSDATFKVPNVRNAQMVYDPVTGKPFLVR